MIDGRFTGADRHAADALVSVIETLVALGMRYDELEHRVRGCDDFVVGHANSAWLTSSASRNTAKRRRALRCCALSSMVTTSHK